MINIFSLSDEWNESGTVDFNDPVLITSCGYQKFITKDFTISRSNGRLDYQIIYIVKGRGYYIFDGNRVEVSEGNVILYPPHVAQFYSYKAIDQTELFWLHFTGSNVLEYLIKLDLNNCRTYTVGVHPELTELFNKIIYELQMKNPMYRYIIEGLLIQLLSTLSRKKAYLASNSETMLSEDIQKVMELMHSSYNKDYSVQDYAGFCNLSLYRFIHKFKQYTGKTPLDYITTIKMNTARDLIINSGFNISEIASLVGYDNPLYFSRVFKKITGTCPSKYKSKSSFELNLP